MEFLLGVDDDCNDDAVSSARKRRQEAERKRALGRPAQLEGGATESGRLTMELDDFASAEARRCLAGNPHAPVDHLGDLVNAAVAFFADDSDMGVSTRTLVEQARARRLAGGFDPKGKSLSREDIAAWCGCSRQAIKSIEARALRKVRQRLREQRHGREFLEEIEGLPDVARFLCAA